MTKRRLVISSVISIFLVSILLIGSTYSIFTSQEIDETANVYKTGNLNVTYKVSSNTVHFTDPTPMTTEEADAVIPYRITVTNTGNVAYEFDVILMDTTASAENTIDYQYIMTKVGYLDPISLSDCTNNIIKENVIVSAGKSVDIDIRLWLDSTLPNTEMGNSFYAKLKIDGLAIYKANEDIDNSSLSLRYMNESSANDFKNDAYRTYITTASFVDYIDTSNASVNTETNEKIMWDMSTSQDKSVIAWLEENETTDEDGNTYYDLYIGSKEKIYAKSLRCFFERLSKLSSISYNNLDTSLTTNFLALYRYCTNLVNLNLNSFDTSNVTNMAGMFYDCTKIVNINFEKFDTGNVTDMSDMFHSCYSLISLDLSNFDTSNVTNMEGMFFNSGLIKLDLSNFDTRNVTNMGGMFYGSKNLLELDLSNFDTRNVTNMGNMFYNCQSLGNLELNSFDTSNVTSIGDMFLLDSNIITSFVIMNNEMSFSSDLFKEAATAEGTSITLYYVGDNPATNDVNESTRELVDAMIAIGTGNIINGGCTGDYCTI